MVAQQRRATSPERRRSGSKQEARPTGKRGGSFPFGKWLLALSLGGMFGYYYYNHEDPPGIEHIQPQLFHGRLNAEQKKRYAGIELTVERAKKCSLYEWPVLETLDYASRWTNTPANILLSTLVVESRGNCVAIPWVYDKEQQVFTRASSAYGPVQMLRGTRDEVSKRILSLSISDIRKLKLIPPELVAPYLSDTQVKGAVARYLNSEDAITKNLGLNLVFSGEYYKKLYQHYEGKVNEPWYWAILAWYTGPGAADMLLESLRQSGLPLQPEAAFNNPGKEIIANALLQISGQGGWHTAQQHYDKMMRALTDTGEYLNIKRGKSSN